ncbi:MAG: CinA family protein [Oscillospiraceae bacterium]|nr:CinA family protein [Oscillospiraceae bacterium]
MMTHLICELFEALNGKTLATAESCTGGMIGEKITAVSGSSKVYKGGIISYTNEIKTALLGVDTELLHREGAVSAPVAEAMAAGARRALCADVAISVTGLAGPSGDDRGTPVGTVYIGYADESGTETVCFRFDGDREEIRTQATMAALKLALTKNIKHTA